MVYNDRRLRRRKIITTMVNLEFVKEQDLFNSIRDTWNGLLEKSGLTGPYLAHEWLNCWWGAYKDGKGLNVIIFRSGKDVIGTAPLVMTKENVSGLPVRTIRFFADHWGGMDFILTEKKEECIGLFMEWLFSAKGIDRAVLSRLPADSENTAILERELKRRNCDFDKIEIKNTFISLQDDWESYLKKATKKFRYEIKSKQRKLFNAGNVTYQRIVEINDKEKILAALADVSAESRKRGDIKSISATHEGRQFYRNIIETWGNKKKLDISLLSLDGSPISFATRIRHNGTCYALETAYNRNFSDYSPGLVVQSLLLERLFREGAVKRYELGETDSHKQRWSGEYKPEVKFIIYNRTTYAKILSRLRKIFKR